MLCGVRATSHLKCGRSPCQHTPHLRDTVQNRTQDVACTRCDWLFKLKYFGYVGINKLNKILLFLLEIFKLRMWLLLVICIIFLLALSKDYAYFFYIKLRFTFIRSKLLLEMSLGFSGEREPCCPLRSSGAETAQTEAPVA